MSASEISENNGIKACLRRYVAECLGTCWLVLMGCGCAVMTAQLSDGVLATSLAFGVAMVAMMAAFSAVSGGHFNPAVTLGAWVAGRFPGEWVLGYVIAQVWGALFGAGLVFLLAHDGTELGPYAQLAGNGYGDLSPAGFGLGAVALTECVLTLGFVLVVLGATEVHAAAGLAPLVIGLCLVGVELVGLPIDNASVNPARSTGVAMMIIEGGYLRQLWLFWVAPLGGGLLAGVIHRQLLAGPACPAVRGAQ